MTVEGPAVSAPLREAQAVSPSAPADHDSFRCGRSHLGGKRSGENRQEGDAQEQTAEYAMAVAAAVFSQL
jgi:hypothetical protein